MTEIATMKDITTANSHAYFYFLHDDATAENGKKRWIVEGKKLRNGVRIGNFELREGFEAPEIANIVRDLADLVDRLCPWCEFIAAPEIVGFHGGEEVYIEGATVATNIRENVPGLTYAARVNTILFSTATDIKDAHEAVFRACWQAIEREAAFGWGIHAKPYFSELSENLEKETDPTNLRLATNPADYRRKQFGMWAKKAFFQPNDDTDNFSAEDTTDEEDENGQSGPLYKKRFRMAFDGITGRQLFAKHVPYARSLKHLAELMGEAA